MGRRGLGPAWYQLVKQHDPITQVSQRIERTIPGGFWALKLNLTQIVDFPTHKKSTLDLMLTNCPTFLSKWSPVSDFGDHDTAALVDMFCHPQRHKRIQRKIPYWNRTDFTAPRNEVKGRCDNFCRSTNQQTLEWNENPCWTPSETPRTNSCNIKTFQSALV